MTRRRVLAWAVAAAIALAGCAAPGGAPPPGAAALDAGAERINRILQDTPEQQLFHARQAYDAGNFAEAVTILEVTLDRRPDLTEAQRLLGHAYADLGQVKPARAALSRVLEWGQLRVDVLARLVELDRSEGRETDLLNHLRLLTLVAPEEPRWRLMYAEALGATGSSREAEGELVALTRQDPGHAEAYVRLGNLYLEQGRRAQAAEAYETAFHLGHPAPELPRSVAELRLMEGDPRQALVWYERALARETTTGPALHLRIAELRLAAGSLPDAERAAEAYLAAPGADDLARAFDLLGRIALARQDTDAALRHWTRAAEQGLENAQVFAFLGAQLFNRHEYGPAADYLSRSVALGHTEPEVMRFHALSWIYGHQAGPAREAVFRYVEQHGMDDTARELVRALEQKRS